MSLQASGARPPLTVPSSTFPFNTDFLRQAAAAAPDVKPNVNDVKPALPAQVVQAQNQRQPTSTSGSTHGGSRTEPPKRAIEVDELQTATPSPEELAQSYNRCVTWFLFLALC